VNAPYQTTLVAASDPRARARLTQLGLGLLVVASAIASALVGDGSLSDASLRDALLTLRGGRFGAAFLSGAALAVAGVLVQGLFQNPLASPSVIGTTAGASLGGRLALISYPSLSSLPALGFLSAETLLPIG
jgi:iron complex transport system permease protein